MPYKFYILKVSFILTTSLRPSLRLNVVVSFKAAFSCLKQFSATESSLKMMENAFYFTAKALPFLQIFKFLSRLEREA